MERNLGIRTLVEIDMWYLGPHSVQGHFELFGASVCPITWKQPTVEQNRLNFWTRGLLLVQMWGSANLVLFKVIWGLSQTWSSNICENKCYTHCCCQVERRGLRTSCFIPHINHIRSHLKENKNKFCQHCL